MKSLKIGNALKLARTRSGFTQRELAERVGVTRQTIGLIEADRYNPTLRLCLLLARETDSSLDELFWIEGDDDEKNLPRG